MQTTSNKDSSEDVYVLLKDCLDAKTGTEYIRIDSYNYESIKGDLEINVVSASYIENNPEWFKKKEQPVNEVEPPIKVTGIYNSHNTHLGTCYQFTVDRNIKNIIEDNYSSLCIAIESAINTSTTKEQTQPIKEESKKDYKILYFIEKQSEQSGDTPMVLSVSDIPKIFEIKEYLKPGSSWLIHSVKRLSDNEVFTIGDKIEGWGGYPVIEIKRIKVDTFDNTKVLLYGDKGYGKELIDAKKQSTPVPLFTTGQFINDFVSYIELLQKELHQLKHPNQLRYELGNKIVEKYSAQQKINK